MEDDSTKILTSLRHFGGVPENRTSLYDCDQHQETALENERLGGNVLFYFPCKNK